VLSQPPCPRLEERCRCCILATHIPFRTRAAPEARSGVKNRVKAAVNGRARRKRAYKGESKLRF